MVNVRTFQNCFQGISGLGVYAKRYVQRMRASSDTMSSSTPETARRNAQMIVGVALTELFHTTSVGAVCYF